MKANFKKGSVTILVLTLCSFSAQGVSIVDESNHKAVGHVSWHKQENINAEELINKPVSEDSTSLFFIRRYDKDPEQTSANIAVNDRFLVSLQPGNYTQVYSCAGINRLSAEATGLKTNDLLQDIYPYSLKAGSNYFFFVDIDDNGDSEIQQITQDTALKALKSKTYQTHQISRVVPNCPVLAPTPAVSIKNESTSPNILAKKVNLELEILFDNDKYIIKPQYFDSVANVAKFMKRYTNTKAMIEGHTDNSASDSYNQKLSQRRADAVKEMLVVQFGIAPSRITAIGYGESKPRVSNATPQGQQENRRVIAVIEERK